MNNLPYMLFGCNCIQYNSIKLHLENNILPTNLGPTMKIYDTKNFSYLFRIPRNDIFDNDNDDDFIKDFKVKNGKKPGE